MDWKEVRDWAIAAIAAVVFVRGLIEYHRAQKWKRAEWVAAEMKSLFADPFIQNALTMLDWMDRRLPLLLTAPEDTKAASFDYDEHMLLHALSSATSPQIYDYSDAELSIRDSFDRLFDGLDRLNSFVEAGLVEADDLKPYLRYWIEILGDSENDKKSSGVRRRVWAYITDYGFLGTQSLLERFGYPIETRPVLSEGAAQHGVGPERR